MKILITSDLFTTATNGVVTSLKNLREELIKKGHDVRVLTFSERAHSYQDGDVYFIRSMPFAVYPDVRMPLSYRHRFVKELIAWKPDVIHSQCEFFSYQFALYISKKTGAPIVHTYHTLYEQYATYVIPSKRLGVKAVRVFSRKRLKKSAVVIAPTRKVEAALKGYGVTNDIAVVPSGIRLEQHKQRITAEERLEKRRALGISDDKVALINLGRLGNEKNLDELVKFFAKAAETRDNIVFLIVGGGPAKESLESLAESLGVSDCVIFTGMVKPTEVHEYYQLGDLFVSASTSETQGLTYVEAAANGLPLLCRDDPCIDDVVIDGENGYRYTDEAEFFEKLDIILADPEWRERARRRSEEISLCFDKEVFGNAVEEIYNSVKKS